MPRVVGLAPALPAHVYPQDEITATLAPLLATDERGRRTVERLHAATRVRTRHLALPLGHYAALRTFGQANDLFLALATDLAERAVRDALDDAGLVAGDVDLVVLTTVTGVGAPSVDVALVERLGMRRDVRRLPTFGYGCAGGAAGLGRVHEHLVGHRAEVALLVAVELCSLTLQQDDPSVANAVSTGLFGDGAAAVVVVGDDHPAAARDRRGPETTATASRLYPGTAGDLGWQVGHHGFRIVLAAGLPDTLRANLGDDVAGFLDQHDTKVRDVATWVVHAGGPKVLDAVREALDLDADALAPSWDALHRVGNLSSVSVLHVLDGIRRAGPEPGSTGLLLAFGPGVSADMVLLRWPGADGC